MISISAVRADPQSQQLTPVPTEKIILQGTSTQVISGGRSDAASGGQAFFCEGTPPTEYQCSNDLATYGCSESCKCCYYEERMQNSGPDDRKAIAR
jgi:hypothetical protein